MPLRRANPLAVVSFFAGRLIRTGVSRAAGFGGHAFHLMGSQFPFCVEVPSAGFAAELIGTGICWCWHAISPAISRLLASGTRLATAIARRNQFA
jgi:hypothetical protein